MDKLADSLAAQAGLLNELITESLRPKVAQAGLTLSMFDLLSAVKASGGRDTQAEIARRLGISAPSLCESVRAAVEKDLIRQEPSAHDQRIKLLRLTPAGQRALSSILRSVAVTESAMLAGIDDGELKAAIAVIRRAVRNLASAVGEG